MFGNFSAHKHYVLLFLSRFLTSLVVLFASLSMSNSTNNKRNKRVQKFNGSYQALTKVNIVR